jgi:aspartate/methionine/tyrosine aminotransferase
LKISGFCQEVSNSINDNPYSFVLNDNPISLLQVAGAKEVALELNSLSKTFNMAGWRVGMVLETRLYRQKVVKSDG